MQNKKIMPTTWLLISLIAIIALDYSIPIVIVFPTPWNLAGIVLLALGIIINLVADKSFQKAGTTVKPFQESSALITVGAFRISRNPMYLGFLFLTSGIAMLLGSLTPWIIIPALATLLYKNYIAAEEKMLAQKFGKEWETYRDTTRRWL